MALTQATKSRLMKLAAFGACGAMVNVVVAAGCAAVQDFAGATTSGAYEPLDDAYHWWVVRWDVMAGTRVMSRCWRDTEPVFFTEGHPEECLASWGGIVPPDRQHPETLAQVEEAWGFPFRALGCRVESRLDESQAGMTTTVSNVLHLREPKGRGEPGVYVPVGVMWPGFLLNTAFYGLAAVAAFAAVRDLRGLRRREAAAAAA